MLGTSRGGVNGPAFVLGWVLGLAVVGAVVLVAAGGAGANEDAELPKWMRTIDGVKPWRALGIAVALSGVNPKNLLLTVGAAAAIADGCRHRKTWMGSHNAAVMTVLCLAIGAKLVGDGISGLG